MLFRSDVERFAHVASMDEIERNGYNLNISRYVDTSEEEEMIDIASNKKALLAIEAKEAEAVQRVNELLAQLGL